MSQNPAVQASKEETKIEDDIFISSTGVKIRFRQIQPMIVQATQAKVKTPPPPVVYDPDKDREYVNSNDPYYLKQLEDVTQERGNVALDAMIIAGVELIDPLPDDLRWFKSLQRLGIVDDLDPKDPDDLEFAYKKFKAVGNAELIKLAKFAGVSTEDVASKLENFPDTA